MTRTLSSLPEEEALEEPGLDPRRPGESGRARERERSVEALGRGEAGRRSSSLEQPGRGDAGRPDRPGREAERGETARAEVPLRDVPGSGELTLAPSLLKALWRVAEADENLRGLDQALSGAAGGGGRRSSGEEWLLLLDAPRRPELGSSLAAAAAAAIPGPLAVTRTCALWAESSSSATETGSLIRSR